MKPSSSPSEPGLFDGVLGRGAARAAVGDTAWLAAMLDAEAALARAQARLGLIPEPAAAAITAACRRPERYDPAVLGAAAVGPGNPVLPLVHALRDAVPAEAAAHVHTGATSQDILDTAAMLVAQRALVPVLADLDAATRTVARLARAHRDTAMAGRTLLQQAMPVTFGLKAAGWLVALGESTSRLRQVRRTRLAIQLGGATGTLDGFGEAGPDLMSAFATELGLVSPLLPWHTDRTRVADLTGSLATVSGVVGKVARDITLLAQAEVGEVTEAADADGHGASSVMAHKHNPIAAVCALACASQAPGLAATLHAAMVQEHERAAGAWHAEWGPLRSLLVTVGSAAAWLRRSLDTLRVNEEALTTNLAHLARTAGMADPAAHLGASGALVERALAAYGRVS